MATDSTTVRVSARIRDRLAAEARHRGVSVSALLADFVDSLDREAMFRAEREATRAEAALAGVREEDRDWAQASGDDVD